MKKTLIIITSLFLMPINVNAASGCCSGHGGVDCSRVQKNGIVVCADGWTGSKSSCTYSGMKKCASYTPSVLGAQKNTTKKTTKKTTKTTTVKKTTIKTTTKKTTTTINVKKTTVKTTTIKQNNITSESEITTTPSTNNKTEKNANIKNEDAATSITTLTTIGGSSYGIYRLIKKRKKAI